MKKALIFGIGKQYSLFKRQINTDFEVIGLTDNDSCKHGTEVDEFKVIHPSDAVHLPFDVVIVTPNAGRDNIIAQLLQLGVDRLKILTTANLSPFLIDPMFFSVLSKEDKKILFKNNVELVFIEPNSKCNRQCWFCPNSLLDRHSENDEMSMNLMEKVLDELAEIDYDGDVTFSYFNEPLLSDDLDDKIKLVKSKLPLAFLHFATNGDYLDKKRLEKLEQSGIDRIIISIYSLINGETEWSYSGAVEAIVKKAESLSIPIHIYSEKNKFTANSTGYFGRLNVHMLCPNFHNFGYHRAGLLDTISSVCDRKKVCESPYHALTISYTGEAVFCCQCHINSPEHQSYIVGDINNESIFDIYAGEKMTSLRKRVLLDVNSKPCTGCSAETVTSILTPPNGPFRHRPRDKKCGIDYLERYL